MTPPPTAPQSAPQAVPQPSSEPTPLSADERLRGVLNFAPYVAETLVTRGWFRVTADSPERMELFQAVGRRVGEMLRREVVGYVDGDQILLAFRPEEPSALPDRSVPAIEA